MEVLAEFKRPTLCFLDVDGFIYFCVAPWFETSSHSTFVAGVGDLCLFHMCPPQMSSCLCVRVYSCVCVYVVLQSAVMCCCLTPAAIETL